jgi:hypothetical protein
MGNPVHVLAIDLASKRNLVQRLQSRDEILRFEQDPLLASLCTCLGLEFEIGNPAFDRFTPFLGGEPTDFWQSQLVVRDGEVGIRIERADGQPLQPRHPDLAHLLDPDSLDRNGHLTKAILFPRQIAERYERRGFKLVIVRDWILNSALSLDATKTVSYLVANEWEIRSLISKTQAPMMMRNELAFFGTHDIVDHLFDSDSAAFARGRELYEKVVSVFEQVMGGTTRVSRPHLLLAYLIGVALDDMAQPRWYGSRTHTWVVENCLLALKEAVEQTGPLDLPDSFHALAAIMRAPIGYTPALETAFDLFRKETACH